MTENVNILIPSKLFIWTENKKDIDNFAIKQFVLTMYAHLSLRKGIDNKCLCSLGDLLVDACGLKKDSNAYNRGYFDLLKQAMQQLQEWNMIGNIYDNDGMIVDISTVKPKERLWFELDNKKAQTQNFCLLGRDQYLKICQLRSKSSAIFWKTLMLYCYICKTMGYNPAKKRIKFDYWTFKRENIEAELGKGFSHTTVGVLLEELEKLRLIAFKPVYVKFKGEKSAPFRIGTVVIMRYEENQSEVDCRLEEAEAFAKMEYLNNWEKKHLTTE